MEERRQEGVREAAGGRREGGRNIVNLEEETLAAQPLCCRGGLHVKLSHWHSPPSNLNVRCAMFSVHGSMCIVEYTIRIKYCAMRVRVQCARDLWSEHGCWVHDTTGADHQAQVTLTQLQLGSREHLT